MMDDRAEFKKLKTFIFATPNLRKLLMQIFLIVFPERYLNKAIK